MPPTISVIVPAYNAALTLPEQLEALTLQTYRGEWEVIVADNGSTDDTVQVADRFADRLPGFQVVDASARRGVAQARNIGAEYATGHYLAFCDADDRADSEWLAAIAESLEHSDFVTGSIDHLSLNPEMEGSGHWRTHVDAIPIGLRFLPYALGGNMAVRRTAFESVGGFPEDLEYGGEDLAMSWELQLAGFDLTFQPRAIIAYRHRQDLATLWRQHVGFGLGDPVLYKRFRSRGMPGTRPLSVVAAYLRLLMKLRFFFSRDDRPRVVRSAGKRFGRLKGSIRERVFYL